MRERIGTYRLGDMAAVYEKNENGKTGLSLLPAEKADSVPDGNGVVDSLIQLKIAGDVYQGAYAPGRTMREGGSVRRMSFAGQNISEKDGETLIETILQDDRGLRAIHLLRWKRGTDYIRIQTVLENRGTEAVNLEMLSSFSLEQIGRFLPGDGCGQVQVHRLRSCWSAEGLVETRTMEELQLEMSWGKGAVRCERFGCVGSMPVNGYFPWLCMEDKKNHIFWGAQLETPSSWQMEIYRLDENIAVDGGIADREMGHWMKTVLPSETFRAPEAILTVCHADREDTPYYGIDVLSHRLVNAAKEALAAFPESEKDLPVIFNEYCTTWGDPSHDRIRTILDAIKGKGFSYFVIDCGWYRQDGVPWDTSMGDYKVSKALFPEGIGKTADMIRNAGMIPGVWFEAECVGEASQAYRLEEHLLHRDGRVLTTTRRRFWDMTDPWVWSYLDERLIGMLRENRFGYLKVDYNDEIGIGADGCESPGEKLRRQMLESYRYFEHIAEELPGIIIENCASGGHRLEPGYMKRTSMASFSDAHECVEIPLIAANLHRCILPQQSQIWAVIRETDSLKRIAWSVISTYLGRMCISGDVLNLTREQWAVIEGGIAFYRKIVPAIRDGCSFRFGPQIRSMRHPEGWQALLRITDTEGFIVWNTFENRGSEVPSVRIPADGDWEITGTFSHEPQSFRQEGNRIIWESAEDCTAFAMQIRRK